MPSSRTSAAAGTGSSAPSPAKKRKLASSPPKSQPSLFNFFGGAGAGASTPSSSSLSASKQRTASPFAGRSGAPGAASSSSSTFGGKTKSREDLELEWAIRESLKQSGGDDAQDEAAQGIAQSESMQPPALVELPDELNRPEGSRGGAVAETRSAKSAAAGKAPDCSPAPAPAAPPSTAATPAHDAGPSRRSASPSKAPQTTTAPSPLTPMRPISDFALSAGAVVGTQSSNSTRTPATSKGDAFSKLMSSHTESKLWAAADVLERENRYGAGRTRPAMRNAPFYKVLTGMPISVDAFRFGRIEGCRAYFLTHFHSDHYGGLSSSWSHGPIYCSATTANLVRTSLKVAEQWIRPLPMDVPCEVPDTGGVKVTLLDANHCPGSSLFLFEGPQTCHILPPPPGAGHPPLPPRGKSFRYLHCGDFRASPRHLNHPAVKKARIDIVYLDTTYLNPRYCFPAQEQVVRACAQLVREIAPREQVEAADQRARKEEMEEERWREEGGKRERIVEEEEEEDWRNPPLRGKALQAANEAIANEPQKRAMQGWLKGRESDEATSAAPPAAGVGATKQERKEGAPGLDADLDEEDAWADAHREELGELEFVDGERFDGEVEAEADREGEEADDAAIEDGEEDDSASGVVRVKEEPDVEAEAQVRDEDFDIAVKKEDPSAAAAVQDVKPPQRMLTDVIKSRNSSSITALSSSHAPTKGKLLVVVGTYTIGKEKIVLSCARALGTRIFCMDSRKYSVYAQLEDHPELHRLLTRDPLKACVHVTNLHAIGGEGLRDHVALMRSKGHDIARAVAFRPTGWTYKPPSGADVVSPSLERVIAWNQARNFDSKGLYPTRDSSDEYRIYGVPYSEHSSFFELSAFALSFNYGRMVPTVNVGSANSRAKMQRWFEKWKTERRRRGEKAVEPRSEDYF